MAVLATNVKLYIEDNGKVYETERDSGSFLLRNDSDGKGDYIHTWNVSGLVQPTQEQLDALDAQAITLESNNQVDSTRRKEYGSWNDQLDEIYHDMDAWKARLQTIKTNNPKS
jgi:hypothetical protein